MGGGHSFPVVPMTRDKIILVTGANSGIGYEIAKWCAMMGATVILACRSPEKTRDAIAAMNHEFTVEKSRGTQGLCDAETLALESMVLDLASFTSVAQFCEEFKQSGRPLHVLFCNAGIGLGPYTKTEDNFERVLQVNYLSHFIIIAKLLNVMKQSGPDCRILLMASDAHRVGTFDIESINYTGNPSGYAAMNYYGRSKLYQIMQAETMARRLARTDVTCNSIHPGVVKTRFGSDAGACWSCLLSFANCLGISRTPIDGAKCGIDLAVNPKHAGVSGLYWIDCKVTSPNAVARNEIKQEQLWKKTLELIGQQLTSEEIDAIEGR